MTLCLATSDDHGIYLAADSTGLPEFRGSSSVCSALTSKIIKLQESPEVFLLASGGLNHWLEVALGFETGRSLTLTEAAKHVQSLLGKCTTCANQAYGRVIGYEERKARFYRIDRAPKQKDITLSARQDVPVGDVEHNGVDIDQTTMAALKTRLGEGAPLAAIIEAIGRVAENLHGVDVRLPVHAYVMRPATTAPSI
jgi:hypothetical protein